MSCPFLAATRNVIKSNKCRLINYAFKGSDIYICFHEKWRCCEHLAKDSLAKILFWKDDTNRND